MKKVILFAAASAAALAAEPVLLSGPEIARLAWEARGLTSADFDCDGKLDTALIDNENAKITLLYQRASGPGAAKANGRPVSHNRWEPVLENSRFEKVSIPTDQRHFALVAADFDGDGRADLALTGEEEALVVRFQATDGSFTKLWKWKDFDPLEGIDHLKTADLNGDGKMDLAVLGKGKLLVFFQKGGGGFADPVSYLTGDDRAGQLFAEDADGDGKTDLLYLGSGGDGTLRWRKQTAPGVFSAEIALPYSTPAQNAVTSRDEKGRLLFTRVNARSGLIEQHAFVTSAAAATEESALTPTLYNLPPGMKVSTHATGDFNGDGLLDIALADSRAAQVAVYLQQHDGTFGEAQTFPSFAGITGLAALTVPGRKSAELAVTSRKEGFGIARMNELGRLDIPTPVPLAGEPAGVVRFPSEKGDASSAAVLVEQDRKWRLDLFAFVDSAWKAVSSRPLTNLKREPTGMLAADLNGDSRADLLLCIPREPAWILPGTADGIGEPFKENANLRAQLTDISPERVALVDLDGDLRAEIVATGTGFTRSLRLAPDGTDLAVADQFNARQPDNRLVAPAFVDTDADSQPELLFGESGSAFFQVLKRDAAGVYRSTRRLEAIAGEVLQSSPLPLGKSRNPHLLVITRDRFWTAPFGGNQPRLELVGSYDTDLQGCRHFTAIPADVNNDKKLEILAFDRNRHVLEVLAPGEKAGESWKSLLHFSLFEENVRFRGRKGESTVREVLFRDFTGDQRPDILVLVHDRVLLYPQG